MNLVIDIETVPAQRPDVLADIRATKEADLAIALANIAPPGNYKKQETIDAWMTEEAPKIATSLNAAFESDVDATYRKTSFDGAFGQVCVIGWAVDDAEPQAVYGLDQEASLLGFFAHELSMQIGRSHELMTTVIGHNVAAFDLRFLFQRSIVNGVRPHPIIARAAQAKPWESEKVFDTMVQWSGIKDRISLDRLCKALSIQTPKGDIDGSKVWDYVKAGKIAEVAEYCKKDVEATRAVFRRMTYAEPVKLELAA